MKTRATAPFAVALGAFEGIQAAGWRYDQRDRRPVSPR